MGTMERMIMSRFFGRKLGLPHFVSWMHNQYHKLVYAEDVLVLNEANRDFFTGTAPKLFCLALPKGESEIRSLSAGNHDLTSISHHTVPQAFQRSSGLKLLAK
jgi:hypothetical protein